MKVKAIRTGYHGNSRKKAGAIFHIDEKEFSKAWMEKVEAKKSAPSKKAASKPKEKAEKAKDSVSEQEVI